MISALSIVALGACGWAESERREALRELAAHCQLTFTDSDAVRFEGYREEIRNYDEKSIWLGVYGGGPPAKSACIDKFVSRSGYRFRYGINKPVL